MNRRLFLQTMAGAGMMRNGLAAPRRPNIVVILADDMGYADTGFNGCQDFATPHIDAIAGGGIRFTDGYVSYCVCSPSRAGLMTGRYQQRFGHENNPKYDPRDEISGLPTTEVALPRVLRDAGYITGQIGKWHLGAAPKFHPLQRGFQEQFGFIGGGHDYFKSEMTGQPAEYFIPLERNGKPVEEKEYLTDAFSREAADFIRRHARDPFFLYLAYNCPHNPAQVPERYLDRFAHIQNTRRRVYAAKNTAMDEGVGRVLAALREAKLDSDTLIFFLSDNGGPIDRGSPNGASNFPLRGGKGQLYEGGIRVPFAARWTGHLPAGKVLRDPVISLDILPTAIAAAGGRLPDGRKFDGVDLMPYMLGKSAQPPHQNLFWRGGGGKEFAVRAGRYKLVRIGKKNELFDLASDIGETQDISAAEPDVLKRLDAARQEWNAELIAPIFPVRELGEPSIPK